MWVSELGGEQIPCRHMDQGCTGNLRIVFTGPKAFLPEHLENPQCTCGKSSDAAVLVDMGFPEADAKDAIVRCGTVQEAVEWLTSGTGGCAASSRSSCDEQAAMTRTSQDIDLGECAICCEELLFADAAMRCSGSGGKRHYFHAHCLTAWIRQCQQAGSEPPTCPECRGPVQIRPRRLEEFLQEKGSKLNEADREALRTFHDSAEANADEYGWSDLRKDLWKAAPYLAVGAGVIAAIAIGMQALSSQSQRNDRNGRDGRGG